MEIFSYILVVLREMRPTFTRGLIRFSNSARFSKMTSCCVYTSSKGPGEPVHMQRLAEPSVLEDAISTKISCDAPLGNKTIFHILFIAALRSPFGKELTS